MWVGEWGLHDSQMDVMEHVPIQLLRLKCPQSRGYDTSGINQRSQCGIHHDHNNEDDNTYFNEHNHGKDSEHLNNKPPAQPIPMEHLNNKSPEPPITIQSLSLPIFRARLIDHFDILFSRYHGQN